MKNSVITKLSEIINENESEKAVIKAIYYIDTLFCNNEIDKNERIELNSFALHEIAYKIVK